MSRHSLREIARLAETSKSTVSLYLNQPSRVSTKTAQRIQQVIDQTGYSPNVLARNFRKGRTNLIIVVMPSLGYDLFDKAMKGAWRVARQKGYNLLVQEIQLGQDSPEHFSKMVFSKEADGVLLLSGLLPAQNGTSTSLAPKPPPIVVGFEFLEQRMQSFPSVHIDNGAAAQQATDYLISQGHKRIGFIGGASDMPYACERAQGYRSALEAAGIAVENELLANCNVSIEEARQCTRRLLHLTDRPTAIFCGGGDDLAIGAIHEIKSSGLKVPQDISVVGFDDVRYAGVCDPPLTTIAQPAEEIGEKSMYRLCAMIEGGEVDQTPWILPHKLIIRGSVAPLKQ